MSGDCSIVRAWHVQTYALAATLVEAVQHLSGMSVR